MNIYNLNNLYFLENLEDIQLFQNFQDCRISEIHNLCTLNKKLNKRIYMNENFWKYLFIEKFGHPSTPPDSWKKAYILQIKRMFNSFNNKNIVHQKLIKMN